MKLFCSYAMTGEDPDEVAGRMQLVVDTLRATSHEVYCSQFDEAVIRQLEQDNVRAAFQETFKHLDGNDALIAIVTSPRRSIGQIMEIGIAFKQRMPIYLFEHSSAKGGSYLQKLADQYYTWETSQDLQAALARLAKSSNY